MGDVGAAVVLLAALLLTSRDVRGCACGCGIYDVGTSYNFPDGAGWMASGTKRLKATFAKMIQ